MYALIAASLLDGVAITAFLAALIVEPTSVRRSQVWLHIAVDAAVIGTFLTVHMALLHHTPAALAAGAVCIVGASWCVARVRANRWKPDDGGGDDHGGRPPDDPDGPSPDWERFERDFWAHVDARTLTHA